MGIRYAGSERCDIRDLMLAHLRGFMDAKYCCGFVLLHCCCCCLCWFGRWVPSLVVSSDLVVLANPSMLGVSLLVGLTNISDVLSIGALFRLRGGGGLI